MKHPKIVTVGVVGAGGFIGQYHLKRLSTVIEGVRIGAVYDINREKCDAIAAQYGAVSAATAEELIESPDIDAVVVTAWNAAHADLTRKCIAAHKPVFCEKPLATTLEDCAAVVQAEKEAGESLVQVGFMRRFDPSYADAKQKIRAGVIGTPIAFKGVSLDPASVLPGHLEGVKKGIYVPWFIEMGSHDADLARWFLEGEPVESYATGDAYVCTELADYNDYDNGFSLTKFDNNTTAFIQVGRTATCSHVESEIVGTKGTIRVNSVPRKNYVSSFTEAGYVEECQESFLARWRDAFEAEMNDFVDCVRTGHKPEATAHDGTMGLKFCLQLHQAYLDGKK